MGDSPRSLLCRGWAETLGHERPVPCMSKRTSLFLLVDEIWRDLSVAEQQFRSGWSVREMIASHYLHLRYYQVGAALGNYFLFCCILFIQFS